MSRPLAVRDVMASGPVPRIKTGLDWIDGPLGGGFVPGTVVMIHGGPGAGKSTLLAQICDRIPKSFYGTAEESVQQVAARCRRLGLREDLLLIQESDATVILANAVQAPIVVLDSIQRMHVQGLNSPAGSIKQMLAVVHAASNYAKATGACVITVCQETKDGRHAGPRALEHDVDASLKLDKGSKTLFFSEKNRYGETDVKFVLKMTQVGLAFTGERRSADSADSIFDFEAIQERLKNAPLLPDAPLKVKVPWKLLLLCCSLALTLLILYLGHKGVY